MVLKHSFNISKFFWIAIRSVSVSSARVVSQACFYYFFCSNQRQCLSMPIWNRRFCFVGMVLLVLVFVIDLSPTTSSWKCIQRRLWKHCSTFNSFRFIVSDTCRVYDVDLIYLSLSLHAKFCEIMPRVWCLFVKNSLILIQPAVICFLHIKKCWVQIHKLARTSWNRNQCHLYPHFCSYTSPPNLTVDHTICL